MKKPHVERHCRTIYESESQNHLFFASRIWLRNYLVGAGLGISVESTLFTPNQLDWRSATGGEEITLLG